MKLRVVWWIPVAAVALAHVTGVLGNVGSAITGVDNAVTATLHLKSLFQKVVVKPIQPVVVPPIKQKKAMPRKAP